MKKIFFLLTFFLVSILAMAQPSGTVVAFAGPKEKIPQGWVICDGSLYDRTVAKFTPLFNSIGVSWGGDGANKFAVPDLQGQFLRGVSGNTVTDPDIDKRVNSRPDLPSPGNSGNNVGSKQAGQVESHTHGANAIVNRTNIDGTNMTRDCSGGSDKWNADPNFGALTVLVTIAPTGGKETRPVNAYVYYIIKL